MFGSPDDLIVESHFLVVAIFDSIGLTVIAEQQIFVEKANVNTSIEQHAGLDNLHMI